MALVLLFDILIHVSEASKTEMTKKQYSHIVIGAGSAGCVVASRIAERRDFDVLLIEPGPDCRLGTDKIPIGVQDSRRVPMKGQSEIYDPRIDWNVSVQLPDGGSMIVPQAKIMGGGSSINGGTALRSTLADSREWVEHGNDAWDFDSVYTVYQDLENDRLRGTCGPHPIYRTAPEDAGVIQKAFVTGAVEVGLSYVLDLNETGAEGVGPSPVCRQGNRRVSAANTFIDPIRDLPNLTIAADSQVDKVLFQGNRVCGVEFICGKKFSATQEVIVCAGAIFSPAILQRSGLGPSALLEHLDIPMISDLPVGNNLSDHPCIPIVARPKDGAYKKGDFSLQMQARWSSSLRPGAIDLQMVCFSYLFAQTPDSRVHQRTLAGTATGHVAGIGCNINKPTSLGRVEILSKDGREYPIVRPDYLQTEFDRKSAREVVRRAYMVIMSAPMQEVLEPPQTLTPDVVDNDDLLDQYITSQLSTTYHFCGSCRMAAKEKGGVVDQSGRVYGVSGLRIADASIIPTVPASNTMWTTMMFAERIGRSIRDGQDVQRAIKSNL